MTGKCYSCWCSFGLFNKEHGCNYCGYSFCKKCLTKKVAIDKTGQECLVCNKCYDVISRKTVTISSFDFKPPDILAKRIAESEVSAQNHKKRLMELKKRREIKIKDEDLMARLAILKDPHGEIPDNRSIPSEGEIEQRLQNIKGTCGINKKSSEPPVLKKDEVDLLLDEILDEVYLDNSLSFVGTNEEHKLQDTSCVDKLIKQVTDEIKLEDRAFLEQNRKDEKLLDRHENLKKEIEKETHGEVSKDVINELRKKWAATDSDEFTSRPWCCICNGDTEFQCLECDGDFYCPRCFKMDHSHNFDEKHILTPVRKS